MPLRFVELIGAIGQLESPIGEAQVLVHLCLSHHQQSIFAQVLLRFLEAVFRFVIAEDIGVQSAQQTIGCTYLLVIFHDFNKVRQQSEIQPVFKLTDGLPLVTKKGKLHIASESNDHICKQGDKRHVLYRHLVAAAQEVFQEKAGQHKIFPLSQHIVQRAQRDILVDFPENRFDGLLVDGCSFKDEVSHLRRNLYGLMNQ